ncbi:HemY domain-containing protein [Psychromonas sp. CNPT3]|uniref:heme biosynthesis HemY N-terminal domain-containing protein n=1 Tax=Psychromonas sp. CNPT3 TaxID=314282 RepID=UPI00006E705D|nr:heme biosynthesis HemY N-terminal domain-containing protein [Psychromonas sp. CNPT3]AGH80064.1 HemY domain-containing protein [Psychromonas sp. CNPT3]
MLRIMIIIGILLLGLLLGPEISANKGYLLISFDRYTTYEMTLINASLLVFLFYFVLLFLEWMIRRLLALSSLTSGWFGVRKTNKAKKNSLLGMLALFEGNTKQAQKLLAKSAARSESPALTYIAAARAAQLENKYELRDEYFQEALSSQKECHLGIGLVWVELQIEAHQYENALATLRELDNNFPNNKKIVTLYLGIYPALEEWKRYLDILNKHRKNLTFNTLEFNTLLENAYTHYFKQLSADSAESLQLFWEKELPRAMRKELTYQTKLLDAYISAQRMKHAEAFLLEKLHKQFSTTLLVYLDKLSLTDFYPLIVFLDKKLKKDKNNASIHRALAYLKYKENNFGAVIEHLKVSVASLPEVKDFTLLASLLEKEGLITDAQRYYREGLLFASR